jgi:hypothetical protein
MSLPVDSEVSIYTGRGRPGCMTCSPSCVSHTAFVLAACRYSTGLLLLTCRLAHVSLDFEPSGPYGPTSRGL